MRRIGKTILAGLSFGTMVFASGANDAIQLPKGKMSSTPLFRLEKQEQVENLSEEAAVQWRDAADCRAEIFMAVSGKGIAIKTVVYDDIKFQNNAGPAIVKADSIQILLQVPGQKGFFNLAMALKGTASQRVVLGVPEGFSISEVRRAWRTYKCGNLGKKGIIYNTYLEYSMLGIDPAKDKIININLIVNDNDGETLKAKLSLVPGMNPEEFLRVSI